MDEQVDVIGFAVELPQLGAEVLADLPHDLLAAGEHLLVEHATSVLGDEHQVDVEVPDDATTTPDVGVWLPAG
jgi:hypothetical protein